MKYKTKIQNKLKGKNALLINLIYAQEWLRLLNTFTFFANKYILSYRFTNKIFS